jgi:hypothetical protein
MRRRTTVLANLAVVMTVLGPAAGCGGGGDDGDDGAGGSGGSDRRVGWVDLAETENSGLYFSNAMAQFWVEPADGGLACGRTVQTFANGECTLTTTESPSCQPACGTGNVCAFAADCSARCVPANAAPAVLQAGDITVSGGSGQPTVTGTLNAAGGYEFDLQASDWWTPGDPITVSAPGATFPAFSVDTVAPPAPTMVTDLSTWTASMFTSGADIGVDWTPGDGTFRVVVVLITDVVLLCVTDDDGHFDVPAQGIAATGSNPAEWLVAVDFSRRELRNEGTDGEIKVTTGTTGGSTRVVNTP